MYRLPSHECQPATWKRGLRMLPAITTTMSSLVIDHFPKLQQEGVTNTLKLLDMSKMGGLRGQVYY